MLFEEPNHDDHHCGDQRENDNDKEDNHPGIKNVLTVDVVRAHRVVWQTDRLNGRRLQRWRNINVERGARTRRVDPSTDITNHPIQPVGLKFVVGHVLWVTGRRRKPKKTSSMSTSPVPSQFDGTASRVVNKFDHADRCFASMESGSEARSASREAVRV